MSQPRPNSLRQRDEPSSVALTDFSMRRPGHAIGQRQSLEWLAKVHAASLTNCEALDQRHSVEAEARIAKVIARCACGPANIATRQHELADIGRTDWSELEVYDVSHD